MALTSLLLLCLTARVGFIILFGHTLSVDASGYDVYAVNLLEGHGYTRFDDLHPDSDIPPLYSFFLAAVYALLGRDARAVALVQTLFDLLTVALVYCIGRRVFAPSVGLVAAGLTALYPYMLFQDLSVNDTGLFTCLLVLALYCAYRALDADALRWAAATGAVLGAAALTKPLALLLVPLWGLWWAGRLSWRRGLRLACAMAVLAAVMTAPWVLRNTALHGKFVFISTNSGSNLQQGNNPCTLSYLLAGWDPQWTGSCFDPPPSNLDEPARSAWHTRGALDYLAADLGRTLKLFLVKGLVLWSPALTPHAVPPHVVSEVGMVMQYQQPAFQAARVVHLLYFGALLLLAILGLVRAVSARTEITPILAIFAAVTFTYVLTHPSTRYRMPLDPILFILSAQALVWLWGRVRRWRAFNRHSSPTIRP